MSLDLKTVFRIAALAFACAGQIAHSQSRDVGKHIFITHASVSTEVKSPFVLLMQDSGGGMGGPKRWMSWYLSRGITTVAFDSAAMRGLRNLLSVDYEADVGVALAYISTDSRLDLSRYAIMGFSKGGTAALNSAPHIKNVPLPSFVFALYPGSEGDCGNTHFAPTKVYIFYGDADQWGNHLRTRQTCQRLPEKFPNLTYIEYAGAHHSYDDVYDGYFYCCGGRFAYRSSPTARLATENSIGSALNEMWLTPR